MMTYNEYRYEFARTGDIVFFHTKKFWHAGRAIQFLTRSYWYHVALVIADHDPHSIMIWHATSPGGVRVDFLSERVGRDVIGIRRIKSDLTSKEFEILDELRLELKGRPYERSWCELIRASWDGVWGKNTQNLRSVFCSELVAEVYRRFGVLPEDTPANEYLPEDLEKDLKLDDRLHDLEMICVIEV